jgi:L-2-hydroxycarboxylate dehydrogenase (NAD+)
MVDEAIIIGNMGMNVCPSVAPTFGIEAMLETNTLTLGVATDEPFPVVFDFTTSISQRGMIEAHTKIGKELPCCRMIGEGWEAVSDKDQVLLNLGKCECALASIGETGEKKVMYKVFSYSTVVEILSGMRHLKLLLGERDEKKSPYTLGIFSSPFS